MAASAIRARIKAVRDRSVLSREYRHFAQRYGEIVGPAPAPSGGAALLASLSYSTFQVKLEGMIAKALQYQGLRPVAAVPRDAELARRYFRLFGVDEFVTLDDYVTGDVEEEAAELLAGVQTAAELKDVRYRGADVGRQVLSTLSRYLHEGSVDLANADVRALARKLLPASLRVAAASHELLTDVDPELVLFNERNYADQGPL